MSTNDAELFLRRETRFQDLADDLDVVGGPDPSVPGSSSSDRPGRYAVLSENHVRGGRSLDLADDQTSAREVAAANHHEGWFPVACFDLDSEGDRPTRYDLAAIEVFVAFNTRSAD